MENYRNLWDNHGILYIAQCNNDHCECGYCGILTYFNHQMDIFMGKLKTLLPSGVWVNISYPNNWPIVNM